MGEGVYLGAFAQEERRVERGPGKGRGPEEWELKGLFCGGRWDSFLMVVIFSWWVRMGDWCRLRFVFVVGNLERHLHLSGRQEQHL